MALHRRSSSGHVRQRARRPDCPSLRSFLGRNAWDRCHASSLGDPRSTRTQEWTRDSLSTRHGGLARTVVSRLDARKRLQLGPERARRQRPGRSAPPQTETLSPCRGSRRRASTDHQALSSDGAGRASSRPRRSQRSNCRFRRHRRPVSRLPRRSTHRHWSQCAPRTPPIQILANVDVRRRRHFADPGPSHSLVTDPRRRTVRGLSQWACPNAVVPDATNGGTRRPFANGSSIPCGTGAEQRRLCGGSARSSDGHSRAVGTG